MKFRWTSVWGGKSVSTARGRRLRNYSSAVQAIPKEFKGRRTESIRVPDAFCDARSLFRGRLKLFPQASARTKEAGDPGWLTATESSRVENRKPPGGHSPPPFFQRTPSPLCASSSLTIFCRKRWASLKFPCVPVLLAIHPGYTVRDCSKKMENFRDEIRRDLQSRRRDKALSFNPSSYCIFEN